jgi:hypothetical protein
MNQCPILGDLPFEILMIDMNSGAILAKFQYIWTFDTVNNWPVLNVSIKSSRTHDPNGPRRPRTNSQDDRP